ncbi:relaxase/mobilization nuclease domain-containing protein [Nocardia amamiensis]|uniref:relaxase/mobilization nuclease domain-containing protein n=1 Tax=Nocardia amamiensis TaxID=404578 RepID=UPI00082DB5D3|nr:relaxase/mobilization nuclease domain-containing protein [Nocardia amamiensis]
MIPKISRGARMSGLIAYLVSVGPDLDNEHEHPHIVAGHSSVLGLGFSGDLSNVQALAIAREIDAPRRAFNVDVPVPNYLRDSVGKTIVDSDGRPVVNPLQPKREGNVWHCSLSLHADEGQLPDEKWSQIAGQFMAAMGFTANESGRADARWVAIRHGLSAKGNDHIHIAASAVREDGSTVNTYRDYARAQEACKQLEERHGLRVVLGRHDQRTMRGYHRAHLYAAARAAGLQRGEAKSAMRTGVIEPPRDRLERVIRASLAASSREADFVRTLRSQGILIRRSRDPHTGEVRGWCAGLRPTSGRSGRRSAPPVMPGGGSISPDLTLPRLRHNWKESPESQAEAERVWQEAEDALARYLEGDDTAIPQPAATLPEPLTQAPTQSEIRAAITQLEQWANRVNAIPAADTVSFTAAARQAAGVFAAWSLQHETKPGLMARAARTLSTYASVPAHRDGPVPDSFPIGGVTGWTTILLAARRDANPMLANLAVLQQVGRTVNAISRAAMATGEAGRARQLADLAARELDGIHREFAAVTATEAAPSPTQQASDAARIARTAKRTGTDRPRPSQDPRRAENEPRRQRPHAEPSRRTADFDIARFMRLQRPSAEATQRSEEPEQPDIYGATADDTSVGTSRGPGDREAAPEQSTELPRERPSGPQHDTGRDHDR